MGQAVRHSKERPHHPTALLKAPLRSKGPPLSKEHSCKSVLGGNRKKEDFLVTQMRLCQICAAGEARENRSRGRDLTSPGGRAGFAWVFRLKITSFQFSLFLIKQTGSLLFSLDMQHLILCQGKAQAEMHSHAGTGLRRTATRRRCSYRT